MLWVSIAIRLMLVNNYIFEYSNNCYKEIDPGEAEWRLMEGEGRGERMKRRKSAKP